MLHAFGPVFALHDVVALLFANVHISKQTVKQALSHSSVNPHHKLSNSCSQQEHNINWVQIWIQVKKPCIQVLKKEIGDGAIDDADGKLANKVIHCAYAWCKEERVSVLKNKKLAMECWLAEVLAGQGHLAIAVYVHVLYEAHVAVQETSNAVEHTIRWPLNNPPSLVSNLLLNCIKNASENPDNRQDKRSKDQASNIVSYCPPDASSDSKFLQSPFVVWTVEIPLCYSYNFDVLADWNV